MMGMESPGRNTSLDERQNFVSRLKVQKPWGCVWSGVFDETNHIWKKIVTILYGALRVLEYKPSGRLNRLAALKVRGM